MLDEFLDRPHLEHVRAALWRGSAFGRAAVMIGSGFSRNADPVRANAPAFPLWLDLARALYRDLYSAAVDDDQRIAYAAANGGVLRLALEYETVFGRGALDEVTRRVIPDEAYRPGDLHKLLLTLPWSDVFTTNYDTLLERTLPELWERRYEIVVDLLDLPGSLRPRIIKLHGSFPTHRPYIITEEDYRTYPNQFAPFVNTVQQALIENVFLLLGFSGDDPNFLQWIGWVRDQLKHGVSPIYLCGLLDLSPARRLVLRSLNVLPIDLGPLFPRALGVEEADRHKRALRWLLQSLHNGEPPYVLSWPDPTPRRTDVQTHSDPPLLPGRPGIEQEIQVPRPVIGADLNNVPPPPTLSDVASAWRRKREQYPGWVILPESNRGSLWLETSAWDGLIWRALPNESPVVAIAISHELLWRRDRIGVPLDVEEAASLESVLDQLPLFNENRGATLGSSLESSANTDLIYLRECWVEVAFALARRGRQDGDDAFNRWMSILESIAQQRPAWRARWHYENCLHHLYACAPKDAHEELERWPLFDQDPFWNTKRASVLAELGQLAKAEDLAQTSLQQIRRLQIGDETNISLLSQEGWTMFLLGLIRLNRFDSRSSDPNRGRWEQLALYRCNPWSAVESLRAGVPKHPPKRAGSREERVHPFTAKRSASYHLGGEAEGTRESFSLLSLLEDAAIPFHAGLAQAYLHEAGQAAQWIEQRAFNWATDIVLRIASEKITSMWFDKVRIAVMPQEVAERYAAQFRSSIDQAIGLLIQREGAPDGAYWYANRQLAVVPELLGRFVFRLSATTRDNLLNQTLTWLSQAVVRTNRISFQGFKTLLGELLHLANSDSWAKLLHRLLAFPIPGAGWETVGAEDWPEPFHPSNSKAFNSLAGMAMGAEEHAAVMRLLNMVRNGASESRKRAIQRIDAIWGAGLLTQDECREYGSNLWERRDEHTGMPADSPFLDFAYLGRPEPEPGLAEASLRRSLLHKEFISTVRLGGDTGNKPISWGWSIAAFDLGRDWLGATHSDDPEVSPDPAKIDWTPDEATILTKKVADWWSTEGAALSDDNAPAMWSDQTTRALSLVPDLLRKVVVPRIATKEETQQLVRKLLDEMRKNGIPVLSCLPSLLRWSTAASEGTAEAIRIGLRTEDSDSILDASEAVYRWAVEYITGTLSEAVPHDLVRELVSVVATRRPGALKPVVTWLTHLVRFSPQVLTPSLLDELGGGLSLMLQETRLPSEDQRPPSDPASPAFIRMIDLPGIRSWGARLTAELSHQLNKGGVSPSQRLQAAVSEWAAAIDEETLLEVKQGWNYGLRP